MIDSFIPASQNSSPNPTEIFPHFMGVKFRFNCVNHLVTARLSSACVLFNQILLPDFPLFLFLIFSIFLFLFFLFFSALFLFFCFPFLSFSVVCCLFLRKFSITRITAKVQVIKELPLLSETPMLKREVRVRNSVYSTFNGFQRISDQCVSASASFEVYSS